jgi:hypothetical protein
MFGRRIRLLINKLRLQSQAYSDQRGPLGGGRDLGFLSACMRSIYCILSCASLVINLNHVHGPYNDVASRKSDNSERYARHFMFIMHRALPHHPHAGLWFPIPTLRLMSSLFSTVIKVTDSSCRFILVHNGAQSISVTIWRCRPIITSPPFGFRAENFLGFEPPK